MEIVADITDCIVELQTIGQHDELKLATCLQEWVQDFMNQEIDSLPDCNEDIEDGEIIEEGEIKGANNDICGRSINIKCDDSKKKSKYQKLKRIRSEKLKPINFEQVLNCKYCPFTQKFGKKHRIKTLENNEWFPVRSFRIHMRNEHSMCEICEIKFQKKYDLVEHCESHLPSEGLCVCNFKGCSYTKKTIDFVFFHAQKEHHGINCFKCNKCDESFTFVGHLQSHIKKHNGDYPYKCTLCGMSYPRFNTLRTHLKAQHNKTVKFMCSECESNMIIRYPSYQSLISHKRKQHKSYVFNVQNFSALDYSVDDQTEIPVAKIKPKVKPLEELCAQLETGI